MGKTTEQLRRRTEAETNKSRSTRSSHRFDNDAGQKGRVDMKQADALQIKAFQKHVRAKFYKYYKDVDASIAVPDAGARVSYKADVMQPCAREGCPFQLTSGGHPTHCCCKCAHHANIEADDHGRECKYVRIPEAEDAPLIGFCTDMQEAEMDKYVEAHELAAVQKLNLGHFQDLTVEDVDALFEKLEPRRGNADDPDADEDDKLCLEKIHLMLTHCMEPPCQENEVDALFANYATTKPRDWSEHFLTVTELYNFFARDANVKIFSELRLAHHAELSRDYFKNHIVEQVERADYFQTLPITVFGLLLFVLVVQYHLRVYDRSLLEKALEEFVNGRDPLETCDANVDDMDSFWEWVNTTGLNGPLGNFKNATFNSTWKNAILASRNILVGDVQLHQTKFDGSQSKIWFLHSNASETYLKTNPGMYLDAARAAAAVFKAAGGDSPEIVENYILYNTYNEVSNIIAQVQVWVHLGEYGEVRPKINVDSVSLSAYPDVSLYVVDALFGLISIWVIYLEIKDALRSLRLGCGEFSDYISNAWNIIDWLQIILRFTSVLAWWYVVTQMQNSALTDLYESSSGKLKVDVMSLSQSKLEAIYEGVISLRDAYFILQVDFALYTVSLVAKFFKSFNCNPRLRIVQDTFASMAIDFAHFFIIFCTIFLPFVLISHILFGSDMDEMSSISASVSTGATVMMGEFGWYADIPLHLLATQLTSGKLFAFLWLWYVSFCLLIVLVLLNMIVAIILEKYLQLNTDMQHGIDVPPIWTQFSNARMFKKWTKGYVPLRTIKMGLENDADPAHPMDMVSVTTLLESFPKMCLYQAIWIVCWLEVKVKVAATKAAGEEDEESHVKMEAEVSDQLHEIHSTILGGDPLTAGQAQDGSPAEDGSPGKNSEHHKSELELELEKISKHMQQAQIGIAKLRRDQDKLVKKVDNMYSVMPKKSGGAVGAKDEKRRQQMDVGGVTKMKSGASSARARASSSTPAGKEKTKARDPKAKSNPEGSSKRERSAPAPSTRTRNKET